MSKKQVSACCVYDFTRKNDIGYLELAKIISKESKKWSFQLEKGESGYEHFQGRISLKSKLRITQLVKKMPGFHWSVTSVANRDNNFYVTKDETRIDGPWNDEDDILPSYIPRQVREIKKLYDWQEKVIELSKQWDTRHIDIIIDFTGNIGKSILTTYMGVNKMACNIPFCNDYKDILRMVMDRPKRGCYLIDMPKAINKERLYQLFSAIETIKNGYAYDDRYNFREEYFDCPSIFVFTNAVPDTNMLSMDRWRFWTVKDQKLIKFKE